MVVEVLMGEYSTTTIKFVVQVRGLPKSGIRLLIKFDWTGQKFNLIKQQTSEIITLISYPSKHYHLLL